MQEKLDKTIGRMVFRVKGSISANNYIEIDDLQLFGPHFVVQLCSQKPFIFTMHFDVSFTEEFSVRLSFSTLYEKDPPKCTGRSCRYFSFGDSQLFIN